MYAFASGCVGIFSRMLRGVLAAIAVFPDIVDAFRDTDLWLLVAYADTIHYAASWS